MATQPAVSDNSSKYRCDIRGDKDHIDNVGRRGLAQAESTGNFSARRVLEIILYKFVSRKLLLGS